MTFYGENKLQKPFYLVIFSARITYIFIPISRLTKISWQSFSKQLIFVPHSPFAAFDLQWPEKLPQLPCHRQRHRVAEKRNISEIARRRWPQILSWKFQGSRQARRHVAPHSCVLLHVECVFRGQQPGATNQHWWDVARAQSFPLRVTFT